MRTAMLIALSFLLLSSGVFAGQCAAKTQKGQRCKRQAGEHTYCWQHR